MINNGLTSFKGRRVLLLQGPIGSFFSRLSCDLKHAGVEAVFKINFNGGDFAFYPRNSVQYRGQPEDWPAFFKKFVLEHQIDLIFLFGDCRPAHKIVHPIAEELAIEVGVFEEGYIRPNYITLERYGVNGYSQLPKLPEFYKLHAAGRLPKADPVGNTYWHMVRQTMLYYLAAFVIKPFFWTYEHHRPLNLLEAWPWVKGVWRKQFYRIKERGIQERLTGDLFKKYFFVPLQVHNDSQILSHSQFDTVGEFIEKTINSFAKHAPSDTYLVIKHHPMDRGYYDYTRLIKNLVGEGELKSRVFYIHDQHLPSLLNAAFGVVVVNSTVGLSAVQRHLPVFVEGDSIYKISEITYIGEIDDFWRVAHAFEPNKEIVAGFLKYLIQTTQLNGSFYRGDVNYVNERLPNQVK